MGDEGGAGPTARRANRSRDSFPDAGGAARGLSRPGLDAMAPRPRLDPSRPWTRTLRRGVLGLALALALLAGLEGIARRTLPPAACRGMRFVVGVHPGVPFLEHDEAEGGFIRHRQEFNPYFFVPDRKGAGELRVAVLGAATVRALPPDGPAWQLGALLEAGGPARVQVVAAGGRGFGIARLEGLQRELLDHEPDALVLYTGHCEFHESRGSRSLDQRRPRPFEPRAWIEERFRLGGYLLRWLDHGAPPPEGVVPNDGMAPMDAGERVRLLAHFRATLEGMAEEVSAVGVPAVWVLPASNLARPPKGSSLPEGIGPTERATLERSLAAARTAVEGGQSGALAQVDAALARYPEHAGLWYLAGDARLAVGDSAGALEARVRARDLDALPVRATSEQRAALDEVAHAHGIAVIDAEALLRSRDEARYLEGRWGNHHDLLGTEAYRVVMEEVYGALAELLPGLVDLATLRDTLPPPGAPLPPLSREPAMHGPVLDIDFRPTSGGPAGPAPVGP